MTLSLQLAVAVAIAVQAPGDTLVVQVSTVGAPLIEVTEELRVGSIDGVPEESFGYVSGVAIDDVGRLYVGDAQATVLRVFDRQGRYLRSIGRKGEGPGEFRQIQGVVVLPSGEIAVWDPGSFRVSVFSSEGGFERSFSVEIRVIVGARDPGFVATDDGGVLIRTGREMPEGTGPQEAVHAWLRYNADGNFVDSIIPPRRNIAGVFAGFMVETASVPNRTGRLVTGRNDEYRLSYGLPDGRAVRIESAYEPAPILPGEAKQWAAYVEEWDRRWNYHSPDLPAEKPVWKSLFLDADGRIWVSRYATARHDAAYRDARMESFGWPPIEWRQPEVFDIVDPRGRVLGTVRLPVQSQVVFARGPEVWTLEHGKFDEAYVVRYRMSGLGAG